MLILNSVSLEDSRGLTSHTSYRHSAKVYLYYTVLTGRSGDDERAGWPAMRFMS